MDATVYVAPTDYVDELLAELGADAKLLGGRLVIAPGPPRPSMWAHDVWLAPERIAIAILSGASHTSCAHMLGRGGPGAITSRPPSSLASAPSSASSSST